ncbi:MAG: beta-galactosidase, partial [Bacteroidota bacterium]
MRPLSFLLVGCLFSCAGQLFVKPLVAPSATEFRSRILFNEGWRYLENNTDSVVTAMAATNTTTLDLPHTWNQWDATDNTAGYRRDASWYLKELTTPADHAGRVCLYFEGANTDSEVYVNGQRAG